MIKKLALLALTLCTTTSLAEDLNNQAYSFIGFAVGEFSYKESGTLSSGLYFETTPSTTNVFNQSGGYTPINKRAGFYINTISTLTTSSEDEYWKATGSVTKDSTTNSVDGIYQQNKMSSAHNELDILLGYFFAPGHQVVLGGSFTKSLMDRNSFLGGPAIDQFNNAHLTPAIGNVDVPGKGAEDLNGNGTLELDELVATYGVDPINKIVNYTETFTSALVQAGYFYDSRFASKALGLRVLGGVLVGVPVYYDVVNTSNPGLEFTDSFNGYNIKSYIGAGWRINKNFGLIAKADYFFRYRDRLNVSLSPSEELQRTRTAFIPENEIQYVSFNLMAYWNFD